MEEDRRMEEVAKEFLQKPVNLSDVESNNDEAKQLRGECSRKKGKLDCLLSAKSWRDLPPELLREIADSFGIIDLLGFRGVCTNWRSASFSASAAIESAPGTHPYFLLYNDDDDDDECILFNPNNDKSYTLNIPELTEATCLASSHGWLLLSQKGVIFFFCPFSRARIDLPPFEDPEISKGSAAFTSSPLSNDCVTVLIRRKRHEFLELHVLERGVSAWVKYEYNLQRFFGGVKGATFADGCIQIMDENDKMITFDLRNKSFEFYKIFKERRDPNIESLPFSYKEKCFRMSDFKKRMKLGNDVAISICAASYAGRGDSVIFIKNEKFKAILDYDAQDFNGVWIQPRFFQLPPNYSW